MGALEIPECFKSRNALISTSIKLTIVYSAYLPTQILVVCVPDVQRFCCEGVGLNLDVGSCDLVDEAGLANVGETCNNETLGQL